MMMVLTLACRCRLNDGGGQKHVEVVGVKSVMVFFDFGRHLSVGHHGAQAGHEGSSPTMARGRRVPRCADSPLPGRRARLEVDGLGHGAVVEVSMEVIMG